MTSPTAPAVERTIPPAIVTRIGNPLLGWLLSGRRRSARLGDNLLLLHVTGRRTGRTYSTPVAYHRQPDGSLLVLTSSGWRVNLRGGDVPVQLTLHGQRVPATAVIEEDPDAVAEVYERLIDEVGLAKAGQRLGIRVNVDRKPTHDELVDAVRREHLSVLRLRTGDSR
jgi:F420H(2)-dependent quinone reductase